MAASTRVVPAQLNFLTIYCPQLGTSESTEKEQILFYYSRHDAEKKLSKKAKAKASAQSESDREDERLRQVGFVRGIVNFARDFNADQNVDSIETEKHRIVVTQLESGWWILASIDLTQLPIKRHLTNPVNESNPSYSIDYSAREVSPPTLLIQQLLRAHRIFLLHNGYNLIDLHERLGREEFCNLLDTFWSAFARNWYVLLHGNPTIDIYGAIKLAAGGELGIGVGEEEWGSGEREVLEGLARGEDGLIDLIVSRFGDVPPTSSSTSVDTAIKGNIQNDTRWIGEGFEAGSADGVIFSGVRNISRSSLRQISDWNHWIYMHGEIAYGVEDNPGRRKRRRGNQSGANKTSGNKTESLNQGPGEVAIEEPTPTTGEIIETRKTDSVPKIPPPIVSSAEISSKRNSAATGQTPKISAAQNQQSNDGASGSETLVKFLTLGYGSVWGASNTTTLESTTHEERTPADDMKKGEKLQRGKDQSEQNTETKVKDSLIKTKRSKTPDQGRFLIGLLGDLESDADAQVFAGHDGSTWDRRNSQRALYVEVKRHSSGRDDISNTTGHLDSKSAEVGSDDSEFSLKKSFELKRVRVVVYVKRPFIYTFLFESSSFSLQLPSFFRTLHQNLLPLHSPLLISTSPSNVATRLQSAQAHLIGANTASKPTLPIYDLVYDPTNLTLRTSIPNIPIPGTMAAEGFSEGRSKTTILSRVEALSLHSQILVTLKDAWTHAGDKERSIKTNKGWWIVWTRLSATRSLDSHKSSLGNHEAILIRKVEDSSASRGDRSSSEKYNADATGFLNKWMGRNSSASRGSAGPGQAGPLRASEGIGVDVRKYVESVLSLNR